MIVNLAFTSAMVRVHCTFNRAESTIPHLTSSLVRVRHLVPRVATTSDAEPEEKKPLTSQTERRVLRQTLYGLPDRHPDRGQIVAAGPGSQRHSSPVASGSRSFPARLRTARPR
jgi:hypothetical protein